MEEEPKIKSKSLVPKKPSPSSEDRGSNNVSPRGERSSKMRRKKNEEETPSIIKEKSTSTAKKKKKKEKPLKEYNTPIDPSILPVIWSVENLSEEQRAKIIDFRKGPAQEFIKSDMPDLQIVRWLIARKWDVGLSTKMYIESMKWREKQNIDTILSWIPSMPSFSFLCSYWPTSIIPEKNIHRFRTYDGYQVIYEKLSLLSPSLLKSISMEDLMSFLAYQQELAHLERLKILKEEKKTGDSKYAACVFVQDIGDLTVNHLTKHCYQLVRTFTECESNNYPETIRKAYIVNVPAVFSVGWKVAKGFMDPATLDKIAILDSDSFKDELLKVIPPECLPIEYGGTLDYHITGGGPLKGRTDLPQLTKVQIPGEFSVTLKTEKQSKIRYHFQKTMNDISLEFYYQSSEDSKKEVIHEIKKEDTDDMVVERIAYVEKSGFYTLRWINHSHAFLPIKRKLRYLVYVDNMILTEKDFVKISLSK